MCARSCKSNNKMHVRVVVVIILSGLRAVTSSTGRRPVTCTSAQVTSLSDLLSTSWVIAQHTAVRLTQCAVACLVDSRCVSFIYNDISNDCRVFAVVHSSSTMTQAALGYRYYDTCRGENIYIPLSNYIYMYRRACLLSAERHCSTVFICLHVHFILGNMYFIYCSFSAILTF